MTCSCFVARDTLEVWLEATATEASLKKQDAPASQDTYNVAFLFHARVEGWESSKPSSCSM